MASTAQLQVATPTQPSAPASPAVAREQGPPKRDFEIVLHVGHPKTATTWLQNKLFWNPETGFVAPWPDSRSRAIAAFVTVNPYFQEEGWARGFFEEELAALADDPRVPVLSEEHLCGNPFSRVYTGRDVADRLHRAFPRAKVLIGIREQKAMAISSYREFILQGRALSLTDFIGTGREPMSFTPVLREDFLAYDRMVGYYQGLYGKENVLVLPIEWLKKDQEGFVRTILESCGCPGRPTIEADSSRVGWSAVALAARRALSPLAPLSPLSVGPQQLRSKIANRLCKPMNRLPQSFSASIERRWKTQVESRYAGVYGESNRRLADLTGLDLASFGYDMG